MPEHPATVHDGDGDALVLEGEGALGDHVQLLADLAALDEDHLALGDLPGGHGGGDALALVRVELLERLVPREEGGARRWPDAALSAEVSIAVEYGTARGMLDIVPAMVIDEARPGGRLAALCAAGRKNGAA